VSIEGQAVCPIAQLRVQLPDEHSCPAAHRVPQALQFTGSVLKLVQKAVMPEPHASGVVGGQAHRPLEHCCPSGQAVAQPPQWAASVIGLMQAPLQSRSPAAHETPHVPIEQTVPAPHAMPQAPQFPESVWRLAHSPPHSCCPEGQVEQPPRANASTQSPSCHLRNVIAFSPWLAQARD
jgi:hypothetical protein